MTNLPLTGKFKVTCAYNEAGKYWSSGYHKGIDLVPSNGTIYSSCDGTVKTVGWDPDGWGRYVRIQESTTKKIHIFCHLKKDSAKVAVGDKVTRATVIGTMGSTGNSTGAHLHFQIEKSNTNRTVSDPTEWLKIPNVRGSYDSKDYNVDTPKQNAEAKPAIEKYKDDTKIASWAKDAVYSLRESKIMNGDATNMFNPAKNITRQEIAVLINNLCSIKKYKFSTVTDNNKYADDAKIASWAKDAVYSLKKKKLMNGDGTNFNPVSGITRQEAAVLINNVYAKTLTNKSAMYADDSKIATWAKTAVYNLKQAGIMSGKGSNKFDPKGYLTRQEAAVLVTNLIKNK